MDNLVYHYTSLEALDGIIGKDKVTFWATKYQYMNDPFEKIWAQNYILSIIERESNGDNESSDTINKLVDRYPYIISFCDIPDYRNMWRLYCNDGLGVCIGLNSDILQQVASENLLSETKTKQDFFESVIYCSRNNIKQTIDYLDQRGIFNLNQNDKLDNLYIMSAFVKCDDFYIENEFRYARLRENSQVLVSPNISTGGTISKALEDITDVKYRMRGANELIPYLEIDFPSNVIEKIIVGYGYPDFNKPRQCIKQILSKNPLLADVQIEESILNKG